MRVLVTRPAREAQAWVADLRQRGIDAVSLPLLDIGPAPDPAAVRRAWESLAGVAAVMFVSGNAVERFFMFEPARQQPFTLRAWAPGPGTRDALLRAGVPRESIDTPAPDAGQFDSQALWQQVGDQLTAGQRVLVVRGGDAAGQGVGRDWLAGQLLQSGVAVESVVTYTRQPPAWAPSQFGLAQQSADRGSLWLFSSSEAIVHLQCLLPLQRWQNAQALVTHPRIAEAARAAGFGLVSLARPTLDDVMASIESIR